MNLFFLDYNLEKCARYHCDAHCNKMILESAQMACTAKHINEENSNAPYKPTHKNHPTNIWVRSSLDNYLWCCEYGLALCKEYTYRRDRVHATEKHLLNLLDNPPDLPVIGFTRFALAMPDQYKCNDPVESYRQYYVNEKQFDKRGRYMLRYTKRELPHWLTELLNENV